MGRALALLSFLALGLAQAAQATLTCGASDVGFDFGAPGPLVQETVGGTPYPVAGLAAYLGFLSGSTPMRFLPTAVSGSPGRYVECQVATPNGGGGGGTLCGAGNTWCVRVKKVTGSLPVDWRSRLYVLVQVVSGCSGCQVHAPTPTLLDALPDTRGLLSVPQNTIGTFRVYFFLELGPGDIFPILPATGSLVLFYRVQDN